MDFSQIKNSLPDLSLAAVGNELKSPLELKIERWLEIRCGKITSSNLSKLCTNPRSKDEMFSRTALEEIFKVMYERRTGIVRPHLDLPQFNWGNDNEPIAIQKYSEGLKNGEYIKCAKNDFDDIVFFEPFEGFGDSPDAIVYNSNNQIIRIVEIKCPVDIGKIEKHRLMGIEFDKSYEYYYQVLGHLIGCAGAEAVDLIIYDAYSDKIYEYCINRSSYAEEIEVLKNKIISINVFIEKTLKEGALCL